jgi:hypothetical protein
MAHPSRLRRFGGTVGILGRVCGTSSAHDARDLPLTLTDTTLHESWGENQPAETRILQ